MAPAFAVDPLGEDPAEKLIEAVAYVEQAGGEVTAVVPFQERNVVIHTPLKPKRPASEKRVTK